MTGYFNPPYADYSNVPINAQYYKPSRFVVSDISLGPTTTVTTSVPHNYVIGQLCRLIVPSFYGSYQLNEQTGYVIDIPTSTEVVLNLSSQGADPFIADPPITTNPPQILAIGDENSGLISSTGRSLPTTAIPGSFVNISPQ